MSEENKTNEQPQDDKGLEVQELPKEALDALDDLIKEVQAASNEDFDEEKKTQEERKEPEKKASEKKTSAKEEDNSKPEKEPHKPKKKVKVKSDVKSLIKREYLPEFPYSFKSVMFVLGFIALAMFAWTIIFNPSMRIDTITVNGNYEFSDSEIMDALDIHEGDHIFTFSGSRRRALIRSTPYVQNVQVQIDFPSHIIINVTERHKLAYISTPDGYIAIDSEGTVLEFVSSNEDVSPVLCGLNVDNAVLGKTLEITDSLQFRKLILVLGAILDADNSSIRHNDYSFFDSVQEVRIVPSGMIFVTVALPSGHLLQVKLAGIENIAENMQWLLYSIKGGAFDDLPAGSLDMTQEEKIYHAYDT